MSVVVVQEMSARLHWLCMAIHMRLRSGGCLADQVLDRAARDSDHPPKAGQAEQAELAPGSSVVESGRKTADVQVWAAARHSRSVRPVVRKVKQK